ncbi:endolytic transglycosylase MltG [Conchiformibius steedae DSM 2580]|uniref:Endolytic murein transglycosylase n=2 Tax=Conchiformibius steedae TaxID=153493 RepID=A0AAE9HXF6_9NEIS|nr:endolytic transglycosylase MltG [Conchiformibius steedae]QMT33002.1 endolytic transglycosylase MltG [Conchiformibius steedae]URD67625.1 endolytic transglycosylase MltG [Conchiformibius steedae DSM 2580]
MKKIILLGTLLGIVAAALFATALFVPKSNNGVFVLKIEKGQGISAVSSRLADNHIIHNRLAFAFAARFQGLSQRLHAGNYKIPNNVSTWQLAQLLQQRPQTTKVKIIEGMRFAQMRKIMDANPDLQHDTLGWSDEKLLKAIDPNIAYKHPEGLFFPDSYEADQGSSDLQIYRSAYRTMQNRLQQAWQGREKDLPYKNPYELLIMASIVEKETGHPDDRNHVAAVFRNRLNIGMRLQTDPTVIYGMGDDYKGNIRRADLQRDTPYNTYTRSGLTPTPIALPGKDALHAAAHPSDAKYLYFVAKMDNSGKSYFSHSLEEHNAAVRKYILKK